MATIKKGTYRFNDDITAPPEVFEVDIPFSLPTIEAEGVSIPIEGTGIISAVESVDDISVSTIGYNVKQYDITGSSLSYVIAVYASGDYGGWNFLNINGSSHILAGSAPEGYGQTITVTADTEVDDTFATWFSANTELVASIKKGTYRFVENPSEYPIDGVYYFDIFGYCHGLKVLTDQTIIITELPFSSFYCGGADSMDGLGTLPAYCFEPDTSITALAGYYSGRGGWLHLYNVLSSKGLTVSGDTSLFRLFTVTSDSVEFTDEKGIAFATWFNENTKPVVKKFTRLYLGDVVYSSGGKCFKRLTKGE